MELIDFLDRSFKNNRGAKERWVLSYSRFIRSAAKILRSEYRNVIDLEDLYQEGMLGLINALNEQGCLVRFSDYAKIKAKEAMQALVMRELQAEDLKTLLRRDFHKYRKLRAELFNKLKRQPTLSELSQKTGFSKEKTEQLERIYQTALNYEEE